MCWLAAIQFVKYCVYYVRLLRLGGRDVCGPSDIAFEGEKGIGSKFMNLNNLASRAYVRATKKGPSTGDALWLLIMFDVYLSKLGICYVCVWRVFCTDI